MGKVCRVCSAPLPEQGGRGRPAEYCSQTCKRAREFAIRRANSALERAEASFTSLRMSCELDEGRYSGNIAKRDWWAGEVERLTAELTRLLGGDVDAA